MRLNSAMPARAFDTAAERVTRHALSSFGADMRRLREDAGITRAELARASGIDPSFLGEIEAGTANPSISTCSRLALGLGADLPLRLYPTTGPIIRDRHQASIAESTLGFVHQRWHPYSELAVRRPSRGWIDLGLHDARANVFIATEIQSEMRRLEQLLRWAEAKASALPSWENWARLEPEPTISRLLIVRETRANRATAEEHRRLLRTSYPADARDALEALHSTSAWPGPAILWAAHGRNRDALYRLVARP
jgi:transcriptional regulator with XRE-family HTH domain